MSKTLQAVLVIALACSMALTYLMGQMLRDAQNASLTLQAMVDRDGTVWVRIAERPDLGVAEFRKICRARTPL